MHTAVERLPGVSRLEALDPLNPTIAALVCLTAIGFAFRLAGLGESLFGDELFTYEVATPPSITAVVEGVMSDLEITPPLYFVLAWGASKLGSASEWLRLPSLIAGTAAIPLVYALGVKTLHRGAALIAAALVALSPFMIFFSTEARAYALMTSLVMLSTIALLRALEGGGRRWWVAFVAFAAAALYAHYTAVFMLFAQAVWALWQHRERSRQVVIAHAAVLTAFLPWLPGLVDDTDAVGIEAIGAYETFDLLTAVRNLLRWSVGGSLVNVRTLPGEAALVVLALAAAAAFAGAIVLARRRQTWARLHLSSRTKLVVLQAAAAPAGAAVVSAVGSDLFAARNFAASWPALALLAGAVLTSLPRHFAYAAAVLGIASFALGAIETLDPDTGRPPYADAAALVDRLGGPGDPVLEVPLIRLAATAPPGRALEVNLERPHELFKVAVEDGERRALAAAAGGRLLVVQPATEPQEGVPLGLGRSPLPQLDDSFRLESATTLPGLVPIEVLVYASVPSEGARRAAPAPSR